jgi:hypothetical protein
VKLCPSKKMRRGWSIMVQWHSANKPILVFVSSDALASGLSAIFTAIFFFAGVDVILKHVYCVDLVE